MTEIESARSSTWKWWAGLEHRRGDRAELRRCQSVLDVALSPAFHGLLRRLGSRLNEKDRESAALVAGILSQIDSDSGAHSFGQAMAKPKGAKATVSDLRFRRILRLETPDELLRELGRAVRMLDRAAPIDSLANDLMRWGDPVRKRWALDYYQHADSSNP